jgi:hypothetical protein
MAKFAFLRFHQDVAYAIGASPSEGSWSRKSLGKLINAITPDHLARYVLTKALALGSLKSKTS